MEGGDIMEIVARRRARIAPRRSDATTFAVMSVVGAIPLMARAPDLLKITELLPLMAIYAVLYALITVVFPAGLALVMMRAPELAARRLAPLQVPAALLWFAVLTLPVWALLLWPLSFLAFAGAVLMATVMGAFVADIGVEFLATHRRHLLDWVTGLALVLPALGLVVAIGGAAVAVWG